MDKKYDIDPSIEPAKLEARTKQELVKAIRAANGTAVEITLIRKSGKTTMYKFPMLKSERDDIRQSRIYGVAKRAGELPQEAFE